MAAKKKKKATAKQKAALAKGRAKLAKSRGYGVTHEFSRGDIHPPHAKFRSSCKVCGKQHTTSQHNAHAFYGKGTNVRYVPAFKLTHKKASGHRSAVKAFSFKSALKHALKNQ